MLKRLASILTIAVVVLAISAGPAMASVCAGTQCGPVMVCESAFTPECPMVNGAVMSHGNCDHPTDPITLAAVSHQAGPDFGLIGAAIPGVSTPSKAALDVGTLVLSDARGAPHMTAVSRT